MNPLVSIILTSYNKPNSVGKAIESVINQLYTHWELFIMDDNSNTETVQTIMKYLKNPKIHYFNSHIEESERYKTTRYATLINKAIPKTKGKYICYLTDDNIYLPNRLKTMVHLLERRKDVDIVYSEQLVKILSNNRKKINQIVRKTQGIQYKAAGRVDHCSVMHTRKIVNEVYKKYGGYWNDDPQFWINGDAAFWKRLNEFKPFYPIPQILDVTWKFPESFQRLYTNVPKTIPNGTLVRGLSNEIFVIDQQTRRRISKKMLGTLNYYEERVVKIPDPFLFKYEEGEPVDEEIFTYPEKIPNQRLIKGKNSPNIYYLQNHKKYRIKNLHVFKQYHFKQNDIVILDEEIVAKIPESNQIIDLLTNTGATLPDGTLFKCYSNYYLSYHNRLHPIQKDVINRLNLSVQQAVNMPTSILSHYSKGEPFKWVKKSMYVK
ncbi:glycosyltransferase [Neobacillus mesonae]|uniref:glycosyltransferase n=1 Tax=Neobacillus mesonae TaxID=1193713 RepID=UPI002E21E6BE|nr:glycosyltransferase [Neobacillus mesonae]